VVVLGSDFSSVSAPPGVEAAVTSSTSTTVPPEIPAPPGVDVTPKQLRQYQKFIAGLAQGLAESGCVAQ
jgi:hypothetical protein